MAIKQEVIDGLLKGYEKPEDLLGEEGLFKQLKKVLLEKALGAELTHHLGYERGDAAKRGTSNSRNGYSEKTLKTGEGELTIDVPRDRDGSFKRCWCRRARRISTASTTRSCRCTPAA